MTSPQKPNRALFVVCLVIGVVLFTLGLAVLLTVGGIGAVSIMVGGLTMLMCAFLVRSQRSAT